MKTSRKIVGRRFHKQIGDPPYIVSDRRHGDRKRESSKQTSTVSVSPRGLARSRHFTCASSSSWKELDSDGLQTPSDSDACEDADVSRSIDSDHGVNRVLAMDCEMVGVGSNKSAVARCSVVDYSGRVVFDEYIKPDEAITDYRTFVSGIRPRHMRSAMSCHKARRQLKRLLKGTILVGHALHNDLRCLCLHHPVHRVRDIAKFEPLHLHGGFSQMPSLKKLSRVYLRRHIQEGEHCSVEDATAAMDLYRLVRNEWEYSIGVRDSKKTSGLLEDCYWPSDVSQLDEE